MQSTTRLCVSIFLLTTSLVSAYREYNGAKLRRDGVLNLYPFPRVGRASPRTWQVPINDMLTEYEQLDKRQLYAFPRVGRGDLELQEPRSHTLQRRKDNPGMWFGPRLGRSSSKEEDDMVFQKENTEKREPEQMEELLDRKKRQVEHF